MTKPNDRYRQLLLNLNTAYLYVYCHVVLFFGMLERFSDIYQYRDTI